MVTVAVTGAFVYSAPTRRLRVLDRISLFPGVQMQTVMSLFVYLSVCLHNSKTTWPMFIIFCACCLWLWIGPPMSAL